MSAYDKAVAELAENEKQWEAFESDGHCAVLAPPGSGKTKLLTTKLARHLLNGDIRSPQGLACITMTNDAAFELRRRLAELGVHSRATIFIGTVHSFALGRIILPFAKAAGNTGLAESRFATNSELDQAFVEAFDRSTFLSYERATVRATVNRVRQRLDYSGDIRLGGPRIAQLALEMNRILDERGIYEFRDVIRHAVNLVEDNEWVRRVLSASYSRVFVDEYQDLAPGLDRIVRGITLSPETNSTLFAVGDPDQAIYGFSGAHPELLRHLAMEINPINLERNYRSGTGIISAALKALGETRSVISDKPGGSVEIHSAPGGVPAQTQKVLELVVHEATRGIAYDQIAVLAPWGSDRDVIVKYLRSSGVPAFARSNDDWEPVPITLLLENMAVWSASSNAHELASRLRELDSVLRGQSDHSIRRDVVQLMLDYPRSSSASGFVERFCDITLDIVSKMSDSEDARELHRMKTALHPGGAAAHMMLADLGSRARAPGHVYVSTVHAAKGLEFDCVVLAGADNAGLPGFNPSDDEIAEARRKFYVSITRARDRVHIVYTDMRVAKSGRPYPVTPSPFLGELGI
ncbi:UvrD-helicase domain-containing protein [Nocardia mangyaensis]|uniref:UvrD-helicase domain-containing protein n=1 Tax=Nocardia mangyaensis TaxID=2213200 RepID=UPI000903E0D8|nr:ATP-dependent helicase [Nocardia mangyaensis]